MCSLGFGSLDPPHELYDLTLVLTFLSFSFLI